MILKLFRKSAQVTQDVNLKELFDKSYNETTVENHGEEIFR